MSSNTSSPAHQFVSDDQNRHFRIDHLNDNLGRRSTRGGVVTATAQAMKFSLSMAASIVLARLLTPQDYGLIGMVVILISLTGMFQYLGLSTATVRWAELTHQQVSTLFWINLGLSTAVALLTIAASPLLAVFYHEPRLIGITFGYAVVLFLTGLYIQPEAILIRQMRFVAIAVIEVSSMAVGLAVAIVAAWYGAGYRALVLHMVVMTIVTLVGIWSACRWWPGLPGRCSGRRAMIRYGGNLTGFHLTNFFSRNLANLLIGKFWGAYQLGVYSKAYQMLLTPMSQVTAPLGTVAIPALSRLADSPERYRAAYLKILEKIAMITMPGFIFMIATSDWLVLLLLGPQWREAGRIFMLLGIAAVVQPVTRTVPWLFTTQGRSRDMLRWGFIGSGIAVASIIAGLPWGALGVAAAYALSDLLIATPLMFWYAGRSGPVRAIDFYRTITPSACAAISSLAVLIACRPWLALISNLFVRLSVAFLITLTVSVLVLAALPAGRSAITSLKDMLVMLFRREGASVIQS